MCVIQIFIIIIIIIIIIISSNIYYNRLFYFPFFSIGFSKTKYSWYKYMYTESTKQPPHPPQKKRNKKIIILPQPEDQSELADTSHIRYTLPSL